MTEAVSDEKIAVSTETAPSSENVVERKTIVYETRIDPTVVKVAAERLKEQLFVRFGFMRPKPGEIQLVSIDKYYEPYMLISGRYAVDYYRKRAYAVKVDKRVLEVILLDHKFEPSQSTDPSLRDHKLIKLDGEERLRNEAKASLILDRSGREVTLRRLPSAPSERNPKRILASFGVEEIPSDADLDFIRSRILKRPNDISRLVTELFEVTERAVIYTPRFKVLYRNLRTGEEKTAEFDGVTAERIQRTRPIPQFLEKLA